MSGTSFLLKLFWLRNYPDESTAKLCALTGIFKVSLESLHSEISNVRDFFFQRISLKPKFLLYFVLFIFILFIFLIKDQQNSYVCIIVHKILNFPSSFFFTICVEIIQQNISREKIIKTGKNCNLVMWMGAIILHYFVQPCIILSRNGQLLC